MKTINLLTDPYTLFLYIVNEEIAPPYYNTSIWWGCDIRSTIFSRCVLGHEGGNWQEDGMFKKNKAFYADISYGYHYLVILTIKLQHSSFRISRQLCPE